MHGCNGKIHQHNYNKKYQIHSCNRVSKPCIIATDVVACIISIESVSYIVPIETATCKIDNVRKLSLTEMIPVRDSFSYNKQIE